jgi:hypothetical protein
MDDDNDNKILVLALPSRILHPFAGRQDLLCAQCDGL